MLESTDVLVGLRRALGASRPLRVAFVVGVISTAILLALTLMGRVDWLVAVILTLLEVLVWYFGLATATGFRTFRRLSGNRYERVGRVIDVICLGSILVCQTLYLLMVLRLAGS